MAKMSLEWPEQLHGIFIRQRACFVDSEFVSLRLRSRQKARPRSYRVRSGRWWSGRLVVERMDDHFEFAVAIQIKDGGDLVHVRSNRLIRLQVNLTGHKLRLNFPGDDASQNDDRITSTPWRLDWRLGERRR